MSKAQRRDHRVIGVVHVLNSDKQTCGNCGDPVKPVFHRESGSYYWRHVRRPKQDR